MKVYISGSYSSKARLRAEGLRLHDLGHDVTSSWLYETVKPDALTDGQWRRRLAEKDIAEVYASDCIILDLCEPSTTGGRYCEWGVALAPGSMMLRYTVGNTDRRFFTQLADEQYDSWDQLILEFSDVSKR